MGRWSNYPTLVQHLRTFSISTIKKFATLEPNLYAPNQILYWTQDGKTVGSIRYTLETLENKGWIELEYTYNNSEQVNYIIDLVTIPSNLGKGLLWYFVCPETNKRCRNLYLIGKYFLHREAHPELYYKSQITTHTGTGAYFKAVGNFYDTQDKLNQKYFTPRYNGVPTKKFCQIVGKMQKYRELMKMNEPDILKKYKTSTELTHIKQT